MENQTDATQTPASEPNAFDLALAAGAEPTPDAAVQVPAQAETQTTGAVDWSFDPNGPMLPGSKLLAAMAAHSDPEVRAEADRYVKGAQELYGKTYRSPVQEAADTLGADDEDDAQDDADNGDATEYDPDDVAAWRAGLKAVGIDPDEIAELRAMKAQLAPILAREQEADHERGLDLAVKEKGAAIRDEVAKELGGWQPTDAQIREALSRHVRTPEEHRLTRSGDLFVTVFPKEYREFIASRSVSGPELGGESTSPANQTIPEAGSGDIIARARQMLDR